MGRVGSPPFPAVFLFTVITLFYFHHKALCFDLRGGMAPEVFRKGDSLNVKVNNLTSYKTQLTYPFYSLPFCSPDKKVHSRGILGEVLSAYVFKMGQPQTCKVICRRTLDANMVKEFKAKIEDEYRVNMMLDNLPLVVAVPRREPGGPPVYLPGFHVGVKSSGKTYYLNNHSTFIVKFHKDEQTDAARVVGFEVAPYSVKHEYDGKWSENTRLSTCDPHANNTFSVSNSPQKVEDKQEVIFTYDVAFQLQKGDNRDKNGIHVW